MSDLKYSIRINAPRHRVWDAMLSDATYREWTAPFTPGSHYQGDWSEGSLMRFVAPASNGDPEGGMLAHVKENRPGEFMSLENFAEIRDGVEVPWQEKGFENYTLTDEDDGTRLVIDLINIPDDYAGMMNEMWPKALERLKEIAEA
jgi:uncharacterized protein YndB with AHSA1/START domain